MSHLIAESKKKDFACQMIKLNQCLALFYFTSKSFPTVKNSRCYDTRMAYMHEAEVSWPTKILSLSVSS